MLNDFLVNTERVRIAPDEVAVKTANPTKVHQPTPVGSGNHIAPKMIDVDRIANTRKLLDGAIVLAWRDVKTNRRPPALTATRWVWRLAAFYHLCHSTPELMEKASQRFASAGRKNLAQWATQKGIEETGHDRLALLDIQSMGYRAEAVVEALVPPAARSLVDYFTESAHNSDPIDCVGYSYTAERLGICIGEGYIQSVKALLPPHIKATRCLRAHSAVSITEVKHVKETIGMIAGLTLEECNRIAKACYQAALLRFSPPKEAYISDEEIQNVLKPLKYVNNH